MLTTNDIAVTLLIGYMVRGLIFTPFDLVSAVNSLYSPVDPLYHPQHTNTEYSDCFIVEHCVLQQNFTSLYFTVPRNSIRKGDIHITAWNRYMGH